MNTASPNLQRVEPREPDLKPFHQRECPAIATRSRPTRPVFLGKSSTPCSRGPTALAGCAPGLRPALPRPAWTRADHQRVILNRHRSLAPEAACVQQLFRKDQPKPITNLFNLRLQARNVTRPGPTHYHVSWYGFRSSVHLLASLSPPFGPNFLRAFWRKYLELSI